VVAAHATDPQRCTLIQKQYTRSSEKEPFDRVTIKARLRCDFEQFGPILHELETYNALLGGPGQLGCCLLVEIDDPVVRDKRLREWRALPAYVYMRCEGGATVRPTVDPAQIDEHRISAVQYLKFHLDDWRPIALGCDLPGLIAETTLTREQRDALNDDLRSTAEFASVATGVGATAQRVVAIHQDRGDNHRRQT